MSEKVPLSLPLPEVVLMTKALAQFDVLHVNIRHIVRQPIALHRMGCILEQQAVLAFWTWPKSPLVFSRLGLAAVNQLDL